MELHLITLESTPDREARAMSELARLKGPVDVKVHRFEKHPTSGFRGCIASHLAVLTEAYEKGVPYVWVCEDNLRVEHPDVLEYAKVFDYAEHNDFEVIFLGAYFLRPWMFASAEPHTSKTGMYRTKGWNHGSISYLMSRAAMAKVIETYNTVGIHEGYDVHLDTLHCLIVNPVMFSHATNIASTINSHQDRFRKVWFSRGMTRITQSMFFHRNVTVVVLIAIVCIVVLLIGYARGK